MRQTSRSVCHCHRFYLMTRIQEQQPYHKTLRHSCFPSVLANDRPCSPLTDHHDPYSQRLVQSCQRLSCRTALNNVEIHVQHDLGLNPQPLLSLSAELYPQSSYLYPRLPLPLIPPSLLLI
ncbi:hypothetical protein P692DRAFT_201475519 [Suillus brevipes Sb2]|nr:hypothetical protein P692DRAFT_201475519 [Suillus brevipes Sb2]